MRARTNGWAVVVLAMTVSAAGAGSTHLTAPRSRDLALAGGGNGGRIGAFALETDAGGQLTGVLNYYDVYDPCSPTPWTPAGHAIDRHAPDGAFVETVATDSLPGYVARIALDGAGVIHTARTDWMDSSVDAIDRVDGGGVVELCRLPRVYDLAFSPVTGDVYAVGFVGGVNSVVKLDLAGGTYAQSVVIGGDSSGLAFDGAGDLWVGTYLPADNALLRFDGSGIDPCEPGFAVLDRTGAAEAVALAHGTADVAVDAADNVVLSLNNHYMNAPEYHALAALPAGQSDLLPLSHGKGYLGPVAATGDLLAGGADIDNAAYVLGGYYPPAMSYVPGPLPAALLVGGALTLLRRRRRAA